MLEGLKVDRNTIGKNTDIKTVAKTIWWFYKVVTTKNTEILQLICCNPVYTGSDIEPCVYFQ